MTEAVEKTTKTTKNATAGANAEVAKVTVKRIAPVIVGISDAVPMPIRTNSRGNKSAYNWDAIEVGKSLAITNKTAKQLASVITNANKRYIAKDAEGKPVVTKHFFTHDCNPATDPEGASVRIFRDI